jgi:hypothetical protein
MRKRAKAKGRRISVTRADYSEMREIPVEIRSVSATARLSTGEAVRVQVDDAIDEDGRVFLVIHVGEGSDGELCTNGLLPRDVVAIADTIGAAINAAHRRGIVADGFKVPPTARLRW